MNTTFKKNSNVEKVYNFLLTHEFIKQENISKKLNIPSTSLSVILTKLRRLGLVEYSGNKNNKRWKKYPINNPKYPPQPDIYNRSRKRTYEIVPNYKQSIKRIGDLLNEIYNEYNKLTNTNPCDNFKKFGEIGGKTVWIKDNDDK